MLRAAAAWMLAFAAASASAAPAPDPQRDFAVIAQRTYFETCLRALKGTIDLSDATDVGKAGLRRLPAEIEKKMVHPQYGQPTMAGAARGDDIVSMAIYPNSSLCTVMLQGPNRASVFTAIRKEILSFPEVFKPDPEQSKPQRGYQVEAFKLGLPDGGYFRAVLMKPLQSDPDPVLFATIGRTKD